MKKPRKSSAKPVKAVMLERTSYVSPYASPEILEHMKNCEAREWIARFRRKTGELGAVNAQSWWVKVCSDIERSRGTAALEDLRSRMNKERTNDREKRA